jgi:hypothetical protein
VRSPLPVLHRGGVGGFLTQHGDGSSAARPPFEREHRRSEILAAVDIAQASTARGEGIEITRESMRELADDVKRRGRARLAAEQREIPR